MAGPDFIDECRIFVRAGDGGRGCVSFRREKFVPRGGPDGGNGGRGGSVVFVGDAGLHTLYDVRHRRTHRASGGAHGRGARKDGRSGADVVVRLPLGTVVRDDETTAVLHEVLRQDEPWIAAEGGRGGRGNASFTSSTRQAPQIAQPGEPGAQRWLRLELKVLADVGLIGFPNAGKSTLVSAVSAARPKVASYPFTTLQPHLGMVERGDARFVIADIPGLIPGASGGAGLGHRFLRHVERTRLLVHLLDPEPGLQDVEGRDLVRDYCALRRELVAYAPELGERPELVCVSKADLVPDAARPALQAELEKLGRAPRWISAATGEGIAELVGDLAERVSR